MSDQRLSAEAAPALVGDRQPPGSCRISGGLFLILIRMIMSAAVFAA